MEKDLRFIQILCKRIRNGKFAWENYQNGGCYHIPNLGGWIIQTERIVCSYGLCGYSIWFPNSNLPEIQWDFDLREMSIDGISYKQWWQETFAAYLKEQNKAARELAFVRYIKDKCHA